MRKLCHGCKQHLELACFSFRKSRNRYYPRCKKCVARDHYIAASRRRERIRDWLNKLKQQPCRDCQRSFPPVAMDFHHVFGKEASIGDLLARGFSFARIKAEVRKCILICAVCHRLGTAKDGDW